MNFQVRLLFKSTSFLWSFGFHRGTVFQVSLNKISCLVSSFFYMAFIFEETFNSWAIDHLMWTFHFFKAGTNFDMNSGRRNYPLWVKSCHDYSPKLVWPGARFSKVPRTFRARKTIRKTTTCLFCKAGLLICCKGNKSKNKCKVSCLETPSFWRYKENYVTRNTPEKFRGFRETGPWPCSVRTSANCALCLCLSLGFGQHSKPWVEIFPMRTYIYY